MNILILTLFFITVTSGLDLDAELKAQPPFCAPVIPATNVNMSWIRNNEAWYFPYMTRNELILIAKEFLNESEFTQMSQDTAASQVCSLLNWNTTESFGFGKKLDVPSKLHYNALRPGVVDWEFAGKYALTTYFVLTDNSSYVVAVDVFSDGTRGAFVMTPEPDDTKFSYKQVSEWRNKLVEVGFQHGNFVYTPTKCAYEFWESWKHKEDFNVTTTLKPTSKDTPTTTTRIK